MSDRYAVIGNPVAHSKSPAIHAEFARATGQDIDYARIEAPLDGFADAIARFRAAGGKGCNVTLPFKHEAVRIAGRLSERAWLERLLLRLGSAAGVVEGAEGVAQAAAERVLARYSGSVTPS